jgi:hypothetical protein
MKTTLAILCLIACGCTVTEVRLSSGAVYRSTRLLNAAAVDEVSIDPATGAIKITGVRSDSSKMTDVMNELIKRVPVAP